MKAVVVHEYCGPEVLKFEDYPDPIPGPGEVLVRVAAAMDFQNFKAGSCRIGMAKQFSEKRRTDSGDQHWLVLLRFGISPTSARPRFRTASKSLTR